MDGELQIKSRQDCESGLRGGEIEGNARCGTWVLIATNGAPEGTCSAADWAVYSEGRSVLRVSVIDPWKFKIEPTQHSGSVDELGRVFLALEGQQACDWRGLGTQSALSPESCTRKTTSNK